MSRRLHPAFTLFEKLLGLRDLFAQPTAARSKTGRARLGMESLEDRLVPSIDGVVWYDADADGIKDVGEDPAEGVTVELYDNGSWADITSTNSSGEYSFTGGGSGPYTVAVTASWGSYTVSTAQSGGRSSVPTSGTANPIGLVGTGDDPGGKGTVAGSIWYDADADGVKDVGEDEVEAGDSVAVDLTLGGSTVDSDFDGSFSFANLWPGSYKLAVTAVGYSFSTPVSAGNQTAATLSGAGTTTKDIGLVGTGDMKGGKGEISGTFFYDSNGNGVWDLGEDTADGVTTVNLYLGGSSVTFVTASSGAFDFTDLWGGSYSIDGAMGYSLSTPVDGAGRSPAPLSPAGSTEVEIGLVGTGDDAGGQGSLSGVVWDDTDGDGVKDVGEDGLSLVTVTLYLGGVSVGTTDTDGSGNYSFTDLWGGPYQLSASVIGSYVTTPVNELGRADANLVGNDSVGVDLGFKTGSATPVNDPPTITVPAAQATAVNTNKVFSGGNGNAITVADPDAASSDLSVILSVGLGTLTLGTTSGLSFSIGDGAGDRTMVFTGTLTEINAALSGLTYAPRADYKGGDTLWVSVDDLGNTGSGGAKSATASVNISVKPAVTKPGTPGSGSINSSGSPKVTPPVKLTCPPTPGSSQAGGLLGNLGKVVSAGPVRYGDGTVALSQTDLASDGFGAMWSQTRSWTNGAGYAVANTNGTGMINAAQPYLISSNGGDTLAVVRDGTRADYYDVDGGVWYSRFYDQSVLTHDSGSHEYVLTDTLGNVTRFHDFSGGIDAAQRGLLKSFADAAGNEVSLSYTGGVLQEVTRQATVGGSTLYESFLYTYLESPDVNEGLIETVTLRRKVDSGEWENVRSVEYSYYDGVEDFGNLGDLKLAVIKDGDDPVETRYYRYYVDEEPNGYEHGLKFLLEGDAFTRMTEDQGGDLSAISDNDLAPYADLYLEYDGDQRVSLERVQGAGCSVCSAGQGQYSFEYTESANDPGVNSWAVKTIETLPDGNTNTVYTNAYAEVMLAVYTDTETDDEWATFYQYDEKGRVVLEAGPSAVTGYDDGYEDLLHWDGDDYEYLSDDEGQITLYGYGDATTATTSDPGDVEGYQSYTAIEHGESGTPILLSSEQYIAHTESGDTVYNVAHVTLYQNADGTGARTTSYIYTFFADTNQIQSVTTTLPVISAEQNGSGVANETTSVLDAYGRTIWTRDAAGFLTYFQYDDNTGALVKVIRDVDDAEDGDFADLPDGWATPGTGGAHLITLYETDALGRTTKVTTPEGRVSYTVYNDADHEVRSYSGWDDVGHAPIGPTTVYREDREHGYTETLTMSATPDLDGGNAPAGTEDIAQLQSLSRSYMNDAGQVVNRDDYFNLGGLAYSTDADIGAEGVNFYRTRFQYDSRGRLTRTVSPEGTIYRTVYDGQGRPVSDWVGTDDTPTTGYWSPDNLVGTNMVKVREYQYDGGGVGDGNLTKVTEFPGVGADRVTQSWFDWRDRAVAVKQGVEGSESTSVNRQLTYFDYDNLGEVTKTRVYDADNVTPTVTGQVPQPLSSGLLRAQSVSSYDDLGRAFLSETYSVNPSSGSVGSSLAQSRLWFDERGQVVKSSSAGLVQKYQFDSLGRLTATFVTDGGGDAGYGDVDDVTGDTVLEQSETIYDDDGLVLGTVTRQRFHDAVGTGELGDPGSGIGARVSYMGYYYDAAGRLLANVDVGTNGGEEWDRLEETDIPESGPEALVTSYGYSADALQVVTLTGGATGGTFTLSFGGYTTGNIAYNASASAVQSALEGLTSIGADNVVVSDAPGGGWEVRFAGGLGGQYQAAMTANGSGLTGSGPLAALVGVVSLGGDTGQVTEVTDPAGLVHRSYFDPLGRTVRAVENFVDGVVSDADDKTVAYAYNGVGMVSLTAYTTGGGGQTTQYAYGVSQGAGSEIDSNDIVGATRWPNSSTGVADAGEEEVTTVNALGQTITAGDRNGNIHTISYDALGRVVKDAVTTLGEEEDVDGAIRRIETAYDGQGNAYLITSYDAASSGNVVNQVKREFNGLGQLVKEWQSHSGAVTSATPKVQYAYSEMAGGFNGSRLTSITYASGYVLTFNYESGLDDTIGRLSSISDQAGTLESYQYMGLGTVVVRGHSQPDLTLTMVGTPGDAGDQYAGLDRFGRVADQKWEVDSSAVSEYQYAYDLLGNRLSRDDLVNGSFDETYEYDDFSQLVNFTRDTHTQDFDYDALGNWDSLTTDGGSAEERTHNAQNEITSIDGATTPEYDANGNMTGDETGKTFVYDAWNRLVAVKDGGDVLKTYSYDGLNRRITETAGGTTTDLIYSASWQVLEEQVGGATKRRNVWSPVYVDAMVLRDRDADSNGTLEERLWVIQDANFNVVALMDNGGDVVERFAYDPFGKATVLEGDYDPRGGGSDYAWVHLHQGGRFDEVSGLYHFRNRDYSATLGRWVSLDPIGYAAGDVNLYGFVGGNPASQVDPAGLEGITINIDESKQDFGSDTAHKLVADWSAESPNVPDGLTAITLIDMSWKIRRCGECADGEITAEGGYKMWIAGNDVLKALQGKVNLSPKHGGHNSLNNGKNKLDGFPSFKNDGELDKYLADSYNAKGTKGTLTITITTRGFADLKIEGFKPKLATEQTGPIESPKNMVLPNTMGKEVPAMPNRVRPPGFRNKGQWTDQLPKFWGGKNGFEKVQTITLSWDYCGEKMKWEKK